MTLSDLNHLSEAEAKEVLTKCCGASTWVKRLLAQRPFSTNQQLHLKSEEIWFSISPESWLEAFEHHPKIGDTTSFKQKFAATKDWAKDEQRGAEAADQITLARLVETNGKYEQKFGYIFIVCATGKSAGEMLQLLEQRIQNDPKEELNIAADEQNKITKLRLNKLLS